MDVTSDTVTANKLMQGYTAHDNTGALITGMATDPSMHTVTLTNAGNEMTYVRYNGTKYYGLGDTISVNENEVIRISSSWGNSNRLFINDVLVAGGTSGQTVGYDYTVLSDVEIRFSLSLGTTDVYITELSDIEALTITQNGTYTASGSTRGYSPITVDVSGSGGGDFTVDQIAMRAISGDISGSATSIGMYAFYSCKNLTTASFPSCTSIGTSAFAYCSSLITANFPSCTSIQGSAFHSCVRLTTVSFPLCTSIENHAFAYCSSLTTVSFPSCTSIEGYAFTSCSSLTTMSFPLCLYIGSYAFRSCTRLTTASFPSCTSISMCAFFGCSSLTTANFPLCISIGGSAFYSCSRLTTASFPLCTSISTNVFAYCTRLTTVSFPSCTSIGASAFVYCYNLLSIYLLGSSVPFLSSNAFYSTPIGGRTTSTGGVYGSIFVPASLYSSYLTATNWSLYSDRIVSV